MTHFDLLNSPLEGRTLIEASAGTGKTQTMAGLYIRLLLEKRLTVDQILVVTFTVAATEELRLRIRQQIRKAIDAFTAGGCREDPFLAGLIGNFPDRSQAGDLLAGALHHFDEAAVFTIHGFCRRILQDKPFECGSLFHTDPTPDQGDLLQEMVDEFWGRHLYAASPGFMSFVRSKGWHPDALARFIRQNLGKSSVRIIPEVDPPDTDRLEENCLLGRERLGREWLKSREAVRDLLTENKGLKGGTYRQASIPVWLEDLDRYLTAGNLFPSFDKLIMFGTKALGKAARKGFSPPRHPFFDLCDDFLKALEVLEEAFRQRLLALRRDFLIRVQEELPRRRQERNVLSFDDLLTTVHQALKTEHGRLLAGSIRQKFRAALIDEFQDTDPVQYAIFKALYPDRNHTLFLIGDPKQAIYSFRGADIFTYLEATDQVDHTCTLGLNWRSSPGLIKAIQTIFSNRENPFVFDAISLHPVRPAQGNGEKALRLHGAPLKAPLQLWFIGRDEPGKPIRKAEAEKRIAEAVAGEIQRLLEAGQEGQAVVDGRSVEPDDMAVLVRTNRQARLVQRALQELGIPGVLHSSESIFSSAEAEELLRVLLAVARPGRQELIKAALVTAMLGVSGHEVDRLNDHSPAWEVWLEKMRTYHELWAGRGFITMAGRLMTQERVLPRLLAYPDGERRATNLLHCLGVLHQAGTEHKFGRERLLRWFIRQMKECPDKEEYQIRPETDKKAVKLVTIHKSKGLEYRIVFCPFCWHGSREKRNPEQVSFHDPAHNHHLTLDLGSEHAHLHQSLAEKETLAENLRLLYVALSRARCCCYLAWGAVRYAETSALAYLLHPGGDDETGEPVADTAAWFCRLDDEKILADLHTLAKKADGTIQVSSLPAAASRIYSTGQELPSEPAERGPRSGRSVPCGWRISSFSSLMAGRSEIWKPADGSHREEGYPSTEASEEDQAGQDEELPTIFHFPKGVRAGSCLHDILEDFDFSEQDPQVLGHLVSRHLAAYGLGEGWVEPVCSMIQRAVITPLEPGRKEFTISSIPLGGRISEMEFYFPVKDLTWRAVEEILAAHGGPGLPAGFPMMVEGGLVDGGVVVGGVVKSGVVEGGVVEGGVVEARDFISTKGFLKGYIDLVFCFQGRYYIVDWKSNYLGPRVEDYGPQALEESMKQHSYLLQGHLYTVALHKYLARRIPDYDYDAHFGGTFFIFLRGLEPLAGPRYGIYPLRPSHSLVKALDQYLSPGILEGDGRGDADVLR